jgi:hypothetical protein
MSTKETQIDFALKRFDQAAKDSADSDAALHHMAIGFTHLCMELKVIGYRLARLEAAARLPELEE